VNRPLWKDVLAALLLAGVLAALLYWAVIVGGSDGAAFAPSPNERPFVNRHANGLFGTPLDCGPPSGLLYPPAMLCRVMPARLGSFALAAVHLWAAGLFMYMLLRTLGTGRLAGFCGGVTFMFSGVALASIVEPGALSALCYAPLMLALVHKTLTRGGLHWPVLTGLVGALQLLAGFPQIAMYTFYLVGAYAVSEIAAECVSARRWQLMWRPVGRLCVAAGTAACVAAPQLWLWMEWRAAGGTMASEISSTIARGGYSDLTFGSMIGAVLDPGPTAGLRYQYTGLATFVLASASLFSTDQRRRMLAIACVGVAGLLMSTGSHSWLYGLYSHVPPERLFGAPHRLIMLWTVAVAILCGVGLDYFERSKRESWSHRRRIEVGLICGAALLFVLFVKPLGQLHILMLVFCLCTMFTVANRPIRVVVQIGVIAIVMFDLTYAATFHEQPTAAQSALSTAAAVEGHVPAPPPRAYVVGRYEVVEKPEDTLARIAADGFDPASTVILSEQPKTLSSPAAAELARATVDEVTFDHTIVTTPVLAEPGVLVLTDTFYPGTHTVLVDGTESVLLRANHIYRAVSLEPGAHTVRFEYTLSGWRAGRWISLAALSILFVAGIVQRIRGVSPRQPEAQDAEPAPSAG